MYKDKFYFVASFILLLIYSCNNQSEQIADLGNVKIEYDIGELDTIDVRIPTFSENGFFRVLNGWVYYFDPIFSTVSMIDKDGEVVKTFLGVGDSPNEIRQDFVWHGRLGKKNIFMGRASDIHIFTDEYERVEDFMYVLPRTKEIYKGKKDVNLGTYNMDIVFNALSSKDLNVDNNENIYIPVRILPRVNPSYNLSIAGYFNDAATLGRINISSGKLESVFGNFPSEYNDRRWEHYDDRFLSIKSDSIMVSYKGSFKIQVYSPYPDNQVVYEFGQQEATIDLEIKDFISFEETPLDSFENGFYSHLFYDSINDLLFRSFISDRKTELGGVQVYRNKDLVAKIKSKHKFNIIGYHNGYYYADGILDEEEDRLAFYKFKLIKK